MAFLIDIIKGLLAFAAVCVGLGMAWLVFIIAREVGWLIRQENRKQYRTKQKQCDFCGPAGRYIAVIAPGGYFEAVMRNTYGSIYKLHKNNVDILP